VSEQPAVGPVREPFAFPPSRDAEIAASIVARLREAGFVAYFVGGCVRDALLAAPIKDIDIATDAPPAAIEKMFRRTFAVGEAFGVMLVRESGLTVEVATFRTESGYADRRRPSDVAFSTADRDVQRRDFTINALFFDPVAEEVIDYVGGLRDLHARLLRTVGTPADRFEEDALRLMRAVRFAGAYRLGIEDATWEALRERAHLIRHISRERIGEEWEKALLTSPAAFYLHFMERSGLLAETLPEVADLRDATIADGRSALETTIGRLDRMRRLLWSEEPVGGGAEGDPGAALPAAYAGLLPRDSDGRSAWMWSTLLLEIGRTITSAAGERGELWESEAMTRAALDLLPGVARRLAFSRKLREFVASRLRLAYSMHELAALPRWRRREMLGAAESAPADVALLATYRAEYGLSTGPLAAIRELLAEHGDDLGRVLPPPVLRGSDLTSLPEFSPGPQVGRVLQALRRAQLDGDLDGREDAVALARVLLREDE
jgi:poly(A) polymerase